MRSFFAIRHIPTGFFLPEPKGAMGRGGSWTEPTDPNKEDPRLFRSERSANSALTQWLRGKHKAIMGWDIDDCGGAIAEYQEGVDVIPVPGRKRDEMEIVPVYLTLTKP